MISKRVATYVDAGIFAVTCAGVGIHQIFSSMRLNKVQETVQMYRDGFPVKMPEVLMNRCVEVLKKVKVARADKEGLRFFLVAGDEPFNMGTLESESGAIVGLPWNFVYKDTDEINKQEIRVFGDQIVNWDSRFGSKLLETLVMTEKEQKFAIAREIYMTDTYRRIGLPGLAVATAVFGLTCKGYVNKYPGTVNLSKPLRGCVKAGIVFICLLNFIMLRDALNMYYEKKADKRAADLGEEYFDGGLSYYAKMLQRGKAYRALMGEEGPKYFTPEGDEKRPLWHYLLVQRSIPLYARVNYLNEERAKHFDVD